LFVSGPDSHRDTYACVNIIEATHRQCEMESALVRDGFVLERYTSNRRQPHERPMPAMPAASAAGRVLDFRRRSDSAS
jgi:hypothetical protein